MRKLWSPYTVTIKNVAHGCSTQKRALSKACLVSNAADAVHLTSSGQPTGTRAIIRMPRASKPFERNIVTWLFVPGGKSPKALTGSLCAVDLAAWNLAYSLHNPTIKLCVTSSGKRPLRPHSWRGWATRQWIVHLSGMTLKPLMADDGVTKYISSLADIHANHSHKQGIKEAKKIQDIYGRTLKQSCKMSNQMPCSLKTSKGISMWDFPKSPSRYKEWALRLKRACSAQQKLVQVTFETGSSYWATPTASIAGNAMEFWLEDGKMKSRSDSALNAKQYSPKDQALSWTCMVEFLKACGAWDKPLAKSIRSSTHRIRITFRNGKKYSTSTLRLNPRFLELLMGSPPLSRLVLLLATDYCALQFGRAYARPTTLVRLTSCYNLLTEGKFNLNGGGRET